VTALWLLALPISWTLAALVARGIVTVLRDLERSHRLDIDEERWTEDERRRREAGRMAGMSDIRIDLGPGPRPTVSDVLDAWRARCRLSGNAVVGLVEGDDGALMPNVRHLAMHAEDLARDLAAAGCDVRGTEGTATSATVLVGGGSITIGAEVCAMPGRPTFVRLSLTESGDAAMVDAAQRRFGRLVNESVTQRSLDHLLVDPTVVALPRGTLDRLLAIEAEHAALRTAALALSRAIEPADLPPHARMALLALRVALGPESVAVPETGDDR
jgi:hypothetical protein